MKTIELMIFDLDGTLVDSGTDLAASVNHTLTALGRSPLSKEEILSHVGDGVRNLMERSLGENGTSLKERALPLFLDYYGEHLLDTTRPFPGVTEVLEHFAAVKKVVLTNKMERFSVRIVETLGLARYFEGVYGIDSLPYVKPDPRLIAYHLETYGARRDRTVVVGDGVNDVRLARGGGVMSCALLNGIEDRRRLLELGPDFTCEDIRELTALFSPP